MPIEFARISGDGRLTLVVHPGSQNVQTYWAVSAFETPEGARENLREREGATTALIDLVLARDEHATDVSSAKNAVLTWLKSLRDIDGAIWTALGSNWQERRGEHFSRDDAVRYLSELESKRDEPALRYARACEYIRNAPEQMQTGVRKMLADKAAFKPATLSAILFEPTPDQRDT